jgi:hypothetical protein
VGTEKIEATVTRMGHTNTYVFATDDYGQEYFVHKKNVSAIGLKGWDWIAACLGDYVVRVEGIPVDQGRGQATLIEVRVL